MWTVWTRRCPTRTRTAVRWGPTAPSSTASPHSWWSSHEQWNEGANDGFVNMHHNRHGAEEAHRVMGYWTRDTLSTSYAIADAHCLCSRWFASLMTSTWPNRFYSLCGTSGGVQGNEIPEEAFPSIFDRCDEAGLVWANYYGIAPFAAVLPASTISQTGFRALEDFFTAAELGTLPSLSVVDPYYGRNDDHPPCHPVAGQVFLSSIYSALAASPQWERCLLVITYDEHGGFFDHVPPPTAADERSDEGFDQLGFRVPTLVAGPWVKSGHVSEAVYDHTAVLAFVEERWGLKPLSERDAASASLTELLDVERMALNSPAAPVSIPVIEASDDELYADECTYFPFRDVEGERPSLHQPELEAVLDQRFRGTRLDRRADADALYAEFLERAEAQGLLRRLPSETPSDG